jgi:PAS domain-containing protein
MMPQEPTEQVRTCFNRAFDARRNAERTADPARKADFIEMEKRWLALAQSYEFSERLTDFTAASSEWLQGFHERRTRQNDASRPQKIIQDSDVDALFERMWLASIVEFCEDAILSTNLDRIITSWNKGAERLFGYWAEEAIGQPVAILIPAERQHEESEPDHGK